MPVWLVSLVYRAGPHVIRTYYQRALDPEGAAPGLGGAGDGDQFPGRAGKGGAKQWVFGYGYALSKRTEVYGIVSSIKNDPTASYDFGTNAIGGITGVAAKRGADPRGVGVGVKHVF